MKATEIPRLARGDVLRDDSGRTMRVGRVVVIDADGPGSAPPEGLALLATVLDEVSFVNLTELGERFEFDFRNVVAGQDRGRVLGRLMIAGQAAGSAVEGRGHDQAGTESLILALHSPFAILAPADSELEVSDAAIISPIDCARWTRL